MSDRKAKQIGKLYCQFYFPKTGWTTIEISGFKRDKDAKDFGKLLVNYFYATPHQPQSENLP